ncbi:MAG: NAD(P)/FAD-dependent oxidoreductase [Candidatus Kapaibacterium sp.]
MVVVLPQQDTAAGGWGYTVDSQMRSFWEVEAWSDADVVVIGGGLIGVQTALRIAQTEPNRRVMLLERGLVPTGASTRNAGFACIGSISEVVADIDLLGQDAAVDIVRRRYEGLQGLMQTCQGYDVGFTRDGGHEIFLEHHPSLDRIDEVNELLRPITNVTTFIRDDLRAREFGFAPHVRHLVTSPVEGTLHSGKLVDVLWGLAQRAGVMIRTGAEVMSIEDATDHATVHVRVGTSDYQVRTGNVVVSTNAWIPELVSTGIASQIQPARGQIIITEPLASMPLRGSYHYDEGYVYFRPVNDRILLGGARNLAFDQERTTSHDVTEDIQGALETLLREVIAPYQPNIRIEHRWAGTMAFSPSKHPIVERVSSHVTVAFGCNGMGVALSHSIAQRVTEVLGTGVLGTEVQRYV